MLASESGFTSEADSASVSLAGSSPAISSFLVLKNRLITPVFFRPRGLGLLLRFGAGQLPSLRRLRHLRRVEILRSNEARRKGASRPGRWEHLRDRTRWRALHP